MNDGPGEPAPYDVDACVVGAGPAGLAAALRLRWVKGYDPFPASVALLDPGPPLGLAGWGTTMLTGPSWLLTAGELEQRILADVRELSIPVHRERALRIERLSDGLLAVHGERTTLRCHAVVLASGFRPLGPERQRFPDDLLIAMKGRGHLGALLRRTCERAGDRGWLVIGNDRTRHLAPLLGPLRDAGGGLRILLEGGDPDDLPDGLCERALRGHLVAIGGEGRIESVTARTPDGATRHLPCGAVFLDYHGFELAPVGVPAGLDELGVERREGGFVVVDPAAATTAAGVFAAGDVTGRYASTLTALGDGVAAGFSAYRHVHRAKHGVEPDLFAYRATDAPVPGGAEPAPGPPLPPAARPRLLGRRDEAVALLGRELPAAVAERLVDRCDGRTTLATLARELGVPPARLAAAVRAAARGRALTVHVVPADRERS